MALASYPGGLDELRKDPLWADSVTLEYQKQDGKRPSAKEIQNPPETIRTRVIASLLRNLDAKRAEQLPNISWQPQPGGESQFLIQDTEIRQVFGRIIGLIAHSHWWPISRVEKEFVRPHGSPHWCLGDWCVDALKIASLLRVADACHLDARRAPNFLRALRRPSGHSEEHWKFQEKLQKPYLSDDALAFSSGFAFPLQDAAAWWLCLESLAAADRELRQVDTLLAEKSLQRLAARRVAGIETPERMIHYVPTEGWSPVDAFVHVSDLPKLVKSLGGKELYGNDTTVALRELIQNGADAVRARRLAEDRPEDWGEIIVRCGSDQTGEWVEVEDSGVGMSKEVLVRYLLDFGTSYWGSMLMLEEYPGLLAKGFQATGKYGIGFFSVFMLGSSVRVRTRQSAAAQTETQVLEFNTGLTVKPILRPASESERIRDGGTCVRIWTNSPLESSLLRTWGDKPPRTLKDLCDDLCPNLDITLRCETPTSSEIVLRASDWKTCSPDEVIRKGGGFEFEERHNAEMLSKLTAISEKLIRDIVDESGDVIGRACILNARTFGWGEETVYPELAGTISVGGLSSCGLSGVGGILVGRPERAARDVATPVVSPEKLQNWASEQATLIATWVDDPLIQIGSAEIVWRCGGDTGKLPICRFRSQWLTFSQLAEFSDLPAEMFLISPFMIRNYAKLPDFVLSDNVLETECMGIMSIIRSSQHSEWPDSCVRPEKKRNYLSGTLAGAVAHAVAANWGIEMSALNPDDSFRRESEVTIGKGGGIDIKESAIVILGRNNDVKLQSLED